MASRAVKIGSASAVLELCVMEDAVGGTAAEPMEQLELEVDETFAEVTAADPWLREHPPELLWGAQRLWGSETDVGHPLVQLCERVAGEVREEPSPAVAMSGVTDMRHLVRYGQIPTVTLGPGDVSVAHAANEWLAVSDFLDAIRSTPG